VINLDLIKVEFKMSTRRVQEDYDKTSEMDQDRGEDKVSRKCNSNKDETGKERV